MNAEEVKETVCVKIKLLSILTEEPVCLRFSRSDLPLQIFRKVRPNIVKSHNITRTYEALGRIVHVAQLEALFCAEGLGQRFAKSIRRQSAVLAVGELGEGDLESAEDARPGCTAMS